MKRIIAIVLLCWSAGVMAEEKVWYCTEVAKAGLSFEDGKYETTSFFKERITIKQDGLKFTFPDKVGYTSLYGEVECKYYDMRAILGYQGFFCTSSGLTTVFFLNPDTGLASYTRGGGWIFENNKPDASSEVDAMWVTALECETF